MSAITINAELKDHVSKQGLRRVYIRITQDKKHTRERMEIEVKTSEWDGIYGAWINKKNKNHEKLNLDIQEKITEYKNIHLDLKKKTKFIDKKHIINHKATELVKTDFLAYWDKKVSQMQEWNQEKGYNTTRDKITEFIGRENLDFLEMTDDWLRAFQNHIAPGLSGSSQYTNFKRIRAIWNLAIDVDKIMKREHYPFYSFKMPKVTEAPITRMEVSELKAFFGQQYENHELKFYGQKGFELSFRLAGTRIEDILTLKWSNIIKGRIEFGMKKGVTNGKQQSFEITPKIKALLDGFKHSEMQPDDYILPFLTKGCESWSNKEYKKEIGRKTALFNKYVKLVSEDAALEQAPTSKIARHSWANYVYEETKDLRLVQEGLKHSNIKITEKYLGRLAKTRNDEKLRAVEF